MSYRQPKYIAPADANVAIEKFNDSMKAFADEQFYVSSFQTHAVEHHVVAEVE